MTVERDSGQAAAGRTVQHATFVIERVLDAPPARVFAAFADPLAKARWFVGPEEWTRSNFELDFRVGGREAVRGGKPGGPLDTTQTSVVYVLNQIFGANRFGYGAAVAMFLFVAILALTLFQLLVSRKWVRY